MNRNYPISQSFLWHQVPVVGTVLVTFTDDQSIADADFRSCLSMNEKEQAATLSDPVEHRHFIARRCFQRLFVSQHIGFTGALRELALLHQRDTQPKCTDAPELHLSLSSSGTTAIACASRGGAAGIDIERWRVVKNVAALAKRYFAPDEAEALAALPASEQNLAFLHYWTAKEAGLKAVGRGIVFGLNTFTLKRSNKARTHEIFGPENGSKGWSLQHLEFVPEHVIALVAVNSVGIN